MSRQAERPINLPYAGRIKDCYITEIRRSVVKYIIELLKMFLLVAAFAAVSNVIFDASGAQSYITGMLGYLVIEHWGEINGKK